MSDQEAPPTVYAFLDYHAYLQAWWEASKRRQGRDLTYQRFGDDAGCTRAAAHNVFSGKRHLSVELAYSFADAMRLNEEETEFFVELVRLKNAQDRAREAPDRDRRWECEQEVRRSWKILVSRRGYREVSEIDAGAAEYLSRWYYPAIRELALLPEFHADPGWIAQTLEPRIRPDQAAEALELLVSLGLLERDASGACRATTAALRTSDEVISHAVRSLYDQVFKELSPRAIDAFTADERELGLSFIAPPDALLPEIKRRMVAFRREISALCNEALAAEPDRVAQGEAPAPYGPARQIFLLGLQFFPLSLPPDAKPGFRRRLS